MRSGATWSAFYGYMAYTVGLFAVLCLPVAVLSGNNTAWLDHAFIAVSAVSTTGLVTVDVGSTYTWVGEVAILLAIQAGGLGYMTLGSFVLLAINAGVSGSRIKVGRVCFNLPASFKLRSFIKRIVAYAVIIEAAGAAVLWIEFGDDLSGVERVWASVFHAVSAFCTAGFSTFSNSLVPYRDNLLVNLTVMLLSLGGALGFILFSDLWNKLRRWKENRLSLTSRIILVSSFTAIALSTMILFFTADQTAVQTTGERMLVSSFQAMSALTTVGFNTAPVGQFTSSSLFLLILLMTLGASPAGTGGGLKSTTWVTGLGTLRNTLRKSTREHVQVLDKEIPTRRVLTAFSSIMLYLGCLFCGCFLLMLTDQALAMEDVLFEATSALGTVGLSTGITSQLSDGGKAIIMAMMMMGRIGPLTIAMALAAAIPDPEDAEECSRKADQEDVVL